MAYQYLLPQVAYYGPVAYMPTMNVNAAFPAMSPMQCMDSCCSTPVTSAFLSSSSCTYSCCAGSTPTVCVDTCCSDAPNIIINSPGSGGCMDCCCNDAPNIIINNPGSGGCIDSCCSDAPNIIINNAGGISYGMPILYEDTCNTTSTYYYSTKPSFRDKKDGKTYYNSYGSGCMMM